MPVTDSHPQGCHQIFVGYGVKETLKVCVINRATAFLDMLSDFLQGLTGTAFGPIGIRAVVELLLVNWPKYKRRRRLGYSVTYRGYPQGAQLTVGLGNVDTPHRLRTVRLTLEAFLKLT